MRTKSITGLGPEEAALLSTLASTGKEIFTVDDARQAVEADLNVASRLSKLEAKGWLERLEKGKYMIVPLEAGPEREWSENALVLASHLIHPAAVGYWSALHHWAMTEQVPRQVYVQSTSRKKPNRIEVLRVRFRFVTVTERKFFGFAREHIGHHSVRVTDREKTILDCLDRPDLSGGIVEVAKAIRSSADLLDWNRLDDYAERLGSGAVVKRLGFLLDAMKISVEDREDRLARWRQRLSAGISKLDPSNQRQAHRIATEWRLWINVDEDLLRSGSW